MKKNRENVHHEEYTQEEEEKKERKDDGDNEDFLRNVCERVYIYLVAGGSPGPAKTIPLAFSTSGNENTQRELKCDRWRTRMRMEKWGEG